MGDVDSVHPSSLKDSNPHICPSRRGPTCEVLNWPVWEHKPSGKASPQRSCLYDSTDQRLLSDEGIALAQHYSSNLCYLFMHFTLNSHWIKSCEACRKKGLGAHYFPELHLLQLILQFAL